MNHNIRRITAFIVDFILIGIVVYLLLEPFYSAEKRFLSDNFFIENISSFMFIFYIALSLRIKRKTIGMKLFKLKLETEECIYKVILIRLILLPIMIINMIYIPVKNKYIQDEISNSKIVEEK